MDTNIHVYINEHDYVVDCQTGEIYSPDDIENFKSHKLNVICYDNFDQFLIFGTGRITAHIDSEY